MPESVSVRIILPDIDGLSTEVEGFSATEDVCNNMQLCPLK